MGSELRGDGGGVHAYRAARIWTMEPEGAVEGHAVIVRAGRIERVVPLEDVALGVPVTDLGDVDLAPGFVDVQVNGGGGVLFNDDSSQAALGTIAKAHRAFGTTSMLPTFITDSRERMAAARNAVQVAIEAGVPGIRGVHFEGPFLDPRKTGAHDANFVRAAEAADIDALFGSASGSAQAGQLGVVLVTAAACRLGDGVLETLLSRGARVALGHCASTYAEAVAAFARGVTGVTHLFNAMSPMESRAPGLVGATLATDGIFAGVIVDGVHADFGAVRAAYNALGPERFVLVTDAVQPVGTDMTEFRLGGQAVRLEGGRCLNEDGNLAGSALDMASAVRNMVQEVGVPLGKVLRMASQTPARFVGLDTEVGALRPGMRADLVALDSDQRVVAVVQDGALIPA